MTTTCQYRFLLLVTFGFVTATGCTSPGLPPWNTASQATSSDSESAASAQSKEELPPKEAARACLAAAEKMQNSGRVEQAIGLYEKARKNDPGLKSVAHHLAVLYDLQGDSSRSLTEYKLAVEAEPKNPDVFSDLGYYYFERGNLSDAERELRKAIQLDPKHQKALNNLGMVLANEKRFDESFAMFSQAVGPAAAHSNVGVLMAKQGRTDEARKEFHEALALDSTLAQPKAFLEYLDRPR
ncbi:MAG: tetratricopeptide repeat protein [Thermoguttaceae bacterium]